MRRAARRVACECACAGRGEHVDIEGRLDPAGSLELVAFECELPGATALGVPPKADALAGVLDGAQLVRSTSPEGADGTLGTAGRPLDNDLGGVGGEADLSNLLAGEVCLAPREDATDGTVVFDLAFRDGRRVEDNPAVGEPCGYALTDAKMPGSVRRAPGDDEMPGGSDTSSLRRDMMTLRPTLTVDGSTVLADAGWQR